MNDKNLRKIIKESCLSPSADFTDALMKKVHLESKPLIHISGMLILVGSLCLVFSGLLILSANDLIELNLFNFLIRIKPVFIQIFGILFVFYVIMQITEILKDFAVLKKST